MTDFIRVKDWRMRNNDMIIVGDNDKEYLIKPTNIIVGESLIVKCSEGVKSDGYCHIEHIVGRVPPK